MAGPQLLRQGRGFSRFATRAHLGRKATGRDELISQLHRGQVPPEDPVEEGLVVVAALVGPPVTQVEAIGDFEESSLVLAQLVFDQGTALLQDAAKVEDRRPLAVRRCITPSEKCDCVAHAGRDVARAVVEGPTHQLGAGVVGDGDQMSEVLALCGQLVLDAGFTQQPVHPPTVQNACRAVMELRVVPAAAAIAVKMPPPETTDQVVVLRALRA